MLKLLNKFNKKKKTTNKRRQILPYNMFHTYKMKIIKINKMTNKQTKTQIIKKRLIIKKCLIIKQINKQNNKQTNGSLLYV